MVLTDTNDYIRVLTLNRPDSLNAFNQAIWEGLSDALTDACDDNSVKVIVITGAGRAFSAGADLSQKAQQAARWICRCQTVCRSDDRMPETDHRRRKWSWRGDRRHDLRSGRHLLHG